MPQMTPEQKKAAAKRRNAAARARVNDDAAQDAEQATEGEVYRMPADHRSRAASTQEGQYRGPRARPRAVAFGSESLVITYEGADWVVNPAPLDNWEDLEQLDGAKEMDEITAARDAVRTLKALFDNDEQRYTEFKDYLRDKYGYVSRNLVFEFVQVVREEAENLGN